MAFRRSFAGKRKSAYVRRSKFARKAKQAGFRRGRRSFRGYTRRQLVASGFPQGTVVKLRFCQKFALNPSVNVFATRAFCANGLYDPDTNIGGESVSMFSTWMSLYNHYQVLSCRAKVTEDVLTNTSSGVPVHFGIYASDEVNEIPNTITTFEQLMEQPYRGSIRMAGLRDNSSNLNSRSVRHKMNIRKFLKCTDQSLLRGTVSSNPSEQAFFICWALSNGLGDPDSQNFWITADFIVKFSGPKARPTN